MIAKTTKRHSSISDLRNSSLTPPQITCIIPAVPRLKEGRFMTVAKRGAGCGGRSSAVMRLGAWTNGAQALRSLGGEGRLRTAKSRGPDARNAGVKSAELSAGDGVKKLRFTRESAIYAVEPLRGEGRSVSAEPVCSCAFSFDAHCTRDRGCGAHPVFPAPSLEGRERPLFEGRANDLQNSGECLSRECEGVSGRGVRGPSFETALRASSG